MIDASLAERKLQQVGYKCQWLEKAGAMRCQNTMSLKFHHRTYARAGNELIDDISVFCPRHHVLADLIRKALIGQRSDIVIERQNTFIHNKFINLGVEREIKFLERLADAEGEFSAYTRIVTRYMNKILNGEHLTIDELYAMEWGRCWLSVMIELCIDESDIGIVI